MKRKIASRRLKRTCLCCGKSFKKDEVYYLKRIIFKWGSEITASESLYCPKCKYKGECKAERYKRFIKSGKCQHPITDEIWTTIVGEDYVKEPSHTQCCICGETV